MSHFIGLCKKKKKNPVYKKKEEIIVNDAKILDLHET